MSYVHTETVVLVGRECVACVTQTDVASVGIVAHVVATVTLLIIAFIDICMQYSENR